MRRFIAAAALVLFGTAHAGAADLADFRKALAPLRQAPADPKQLNPDILAVRDGLRDWIETRLAQFPQNGNTEALNKTLNGEIAAADLACIEGKAPGYNRCASPAELNTRGFLGLVDVERVRDFLIVQAEIGMGCGFDETAYLYEWTKNGWRRLVDTSQTVVGGVYRPEQIQQVMFGIPPNKPRDALLVAVTGASPVCGAPYQALHYRVWSAKRGAGASLAVEGREADGMPSRRDPAVSARFEGGDALFEMDVRSFDPSRRARIAVRRFSFDGDTPRRVAPIALGPKDFVEEWLLAPWSAASAWTETRARGALEKTHTELAANLARVTFLGAPQRCETDDVIQVGARFANGERFFRLKAGAKGAYEMLGIASESQKSCTRPDAALDARHTLF